MESKYVQSTIQILFLFEIVFLGLGCGNVSNNRVIAPVSLRLSNLPAIETTGNSAAIRYQLSNAVGTERVYCRRDNNAIMTCPNPFVFEISSKDALGTHKIDFYVDSGKGIVENAPHVSYAWNIVSATAPAILSLANLPAVETLRTAAAIKYKINNAVGTETVYCRVDDKAPAICPNPFVLKNRSSLKPGRHTVEFFLNQDEESIAKNPHVSYSWKVIAGRTSDAKNKTPDTIRLGRNSAVIGLNTAPN